MYWTFSDLIQKNVNFWHSLQILLPISTIKNWTKSCQNVLCILWCDVGEKKSSSFLFFFLIFFRADVNDVLSIRFLGCFNEGCRKFQKFGGPVSLQVLNTIIYWHTLKFLISVLHFPQLAWPGLAWKNVTRLQSCA